MGVNRVHLANPFERLYLSSFDSFVLSFFPCLHTSSWFVSKDGLRSVARGLCISLILLAQPLLIIAENCFERRRKGKQIIATKIIGTTFGKPVAGIVDRNGHDKNEGPGAQPHELPSSTRRMQSSDVEWHCGHLPGSNARSATLLSTPLEGQLSAVQGPVQIHRTSRSELFWILMTLILVLTSKLIIYMLYNTSQTKNSTSHRSWSLYCFS